jgi:hypothetical protein
LLISCPVAKACHLKGSNIAKSDKLQQGATRQQHALFSFLFFSFFLFSFLFLKKEKHTEMSTHQHVAVACMLAADEPPAPPEMRIKLHICISSFFLPALTHHPSPRGSLANKIK